MGSVNETQSRQVNVKFDTNKHYSGILRNDKGHDKITQKLMLITDLSQERKQVLQHIYDKVVVCMDSVDAFLQEESWVAFLNNDLNKINSLYQGNDWRYISFAEMVTLYYMTLDKYLVESNKDSELIKVKRELAKVREELTTVKKELVRTKEELATVKRELGQ